jgi:hypothetical protein
LTPLGISMHFSFLVMGLNYVISHIYIHRKSFT